MKDQTKACVGDIDKAHEEMRRAFSMITGKWKLEILWLLHQRVHRFGELRKGLKGITRNMLTTQLRELEADGLISRTVFAEVPPRVDYGLTPAAFGLAPVMSALIDWWGEYGRLGADRDVAKAV
jgi:DNA-binding HxlR family transcriptional regulator